MVQPSPTQSQQQTPADSYVSLVRGGPFYRVQEALRLVGPGHWNLGRRIICAIAVGWLPLVLITLLYDPHAVPGLLTDYPVNARMLVGVPVLLVGQRVMEAAFHTMVGQIRAAGLLSPPELQRMDQAIARLVRLRDSVIPELAIVVLAYARVAGAAVSYQGIARPWMMNGMHGSAAGWYYVLVSQLLYQLLLGISLWKWLLWSLFLFQLSKRDLQLVPTHPDRHGGIGFMGLSPMAIVPTIFVAATSIGATWRTAILRQGVHLMSFRPYSIALAVAILIISMGPLVLLVPKLWQLRLRGLLEYGILGQLHGTDFHKKWIVSRAGHEEEFLTAPDSSTVTDFGTTYQTIEDLQPFPFDRGAFVAIVLAFAIPMLPVVLAEIPFSVVLKGLLEAVR